MIYSHLFYFIGLECQKAMDLFEKVRKRRLNQVQFIALGFFIIIISGALLLMLPVSARDGQGTDFISALFTATSSTCVTGLIVADTWTHWSLFGQIIILLMIQIGGLGFVTIGVAFAVLFRRKIGLRQRDLLKESVNALEIGGIVKLARRIIMGTFMFEGIGAVILSIRFIPEMGAARGIYYGIFHAVSAFCNAGFDLMGYKGQYSSLSSYVGDPVVNLVICLLIIIGGIGFVVWSDIYTNRLKFQRYTLHTKLVLTVTLILIVSGTLILYVVERRYTLAGLSAGEKFWASLFGAVTARTAGFNTVDTASLSPAGKIFTMILMFIGGSPGSTAGGIKTTTIAVMVIFLFSNLRNDSGCNVFHRRISAEIINKAAMVFSLNLFLAVGAILVILATNALPMEDILFEVFSAIGTAGMSTGITRQLNTIGRIVIILLMYCGRIGSMTFALSFIYRPQKAQITLPVEKVTIG